MLKTNRLLTKAPFRIAFLLIFCSFIIISFFHKISFSTDFIYKIILLYSMFLYLKYIKTSKTNNLAHKIVRQYSQMQTIINNISIALYLKDSDGRIIISNNGHEDIFGQNLKNLTGKKISEIFQNEKDMDNEDLNIIKNKVCSETIKKLTLKNSSKTTWVKINKSPVKNEHGEVCAIVVSMINYDKFIETEKKKNTFVATITHDLKTPTNAQIKALDLLLNNKFGNLMQKQREIITEIKNSCNYMNSLIFSILDTYNSEEAEMKFEKFNFTKLVKECSEEISYLAFEKNQKLSYILPNSEVIIKGDRTQLKRVIINLLANAIYYGRINTVIEVKIRNNKGKNTEFSVKNHSVYIPKEKINSLFEKYKRGEIGTGSGLGLYLSKQIILRHKGKINAESSVNNDCIFSFSIPQNIDEDNISVIEMVS